MNQQNEMWEVAAALAQVYWSTEVETLETPIAASKFLSEQGFKDLVYWFKNNPIYLCRELYKAFLVSEQEKYNEGIEQ